MEPERGEARAGPSRRAWVLGAGAATLAWGVGAGSARALRVQPLVLDLRSAGRQTSGVVQVQNALETAMSIDTRVERLLVQETGPPVLEANPGEEFLILPPQATVQPGATQNFRVRWVGDPDLRESRVYLLSFQQLPISGPQAGAAVQFLYSIGVVAAVGPPNGQPAIGIAEARAGRTAEGAPGVEFLVENQSNTHGFISAARLIVRQRDARGSVVRQRTYEPSELNAALGLGLMPAFGRRRFVVPFEIVAGAPSFSAEFVRVAR